MATVADVRDREALKELTDAEITPHLLRAERDYRNIIFEDDTEAYDRVEAISCKTIYYLAPKLWLHIQQRANEYDETMQTFTDVEVYQQYWLDRAESIPYTIQIDEGEQNNKFGSIGTGSY